MSINPDHIDYLAAIIRDVNGDYNLNASALAKAILSHPGSTWQAWADQMCDPRAIAASALRAASVRTENLIGDTPHPKFAEGVLAAQDFLERIATELEAPASLLQQLPASAPAVLPVAVSDAVVLSEIAAMNSEGVTRLRANTLAERLWPDGRRQNANGQVFHLGAAVAARLLRRCPAVYEKESRLWEILPHRLPLPQAGEDEA
jgi:hypothetical protein